jgi:hypothetical protein
MIALRLKPIEGDAALGGFAAESTDIAPVNQLLVRQVTADWTPHMINEGLTTVVAAGGLGK